MGYPNVYSGSWFGFFAPSKTPGPIGAKPISMINEVIADPKVMQKLKVIGFNPIVKDTAATVDYFKAEIANWGKMVKAVGLTVDFFFYRYGDHRDLHSFPTRRSPDLDGAPA